MAFKKKDMKRKKLVGGNRYERKNVASEKIGLKQK